MPEMLAANERYVPAGSQADAVMTVVEVDSELAQSFRARGPFDSSVPPKADVLVPADCVWAAKLHPGPMPHGTQSGNLKTRVRSLGPVQGRMLREFVDAFGAPAANLVRPDGLRSISWSGGSLFGGFWSVGYIFDRYNVCAGISGSTGI